MLKTPFSRFAGWLFSCLLATTLLLGQSDTSQIVGYVRDASGGSVPNAKVQAINEGTGIERQTTTSGDGYFILTNLPPGYYTVTTEVTGFKKYVKKSNKLDAAIPLSIQVQLEVGAVTESVEVSASVAVVQADSATVGRTIEAQQIQNMALNGRNPLLLAQLKPGVRSGSMNRFTFGLDSAGLAINGARTQDFLITFDGAVGIRTRSNGTSIGTADVDTVQEVQILTSNYNAEYGRSAGGQVRMVTKSGGRDFHLSLYDYLRNRSLDANSWQRNVNGQAKPQNTFNQFGFVISGPVYLPGKWNTERNKLFFLFSQEYIRYRREVTSTGVVPTALMKQGNFSELLTTNPFFSARSINDPLNNQPFAGNIIPASRVSASGSGLLKAFPDPIPGYQQGRNNWFAARPQPQNQRKDTLSVDFLPTNNQTVRLRWMNYEYNELQGFRGTFDRAVQDWSRPNDSASINHIWTISPTMINEFSISASVDRVYIGVETARGVHRRSAYGIAYPYIYPERKEIFDKIPTITINQFSEVDGGPYPSQSAGPIYVISNNLTKIIGSHTLKFGGVFERAGQNDFDQINVNGVPGGTNNQNGRFIFSDARTGAATSGLAVANAALGLFDSYAEIGPRSYTPYRGHMFEGFIQDSWKATSKLRLELGLRYTIMQPYYYSLWGNIAIFDSSRYDPAKAVVMDPRTGNVLSGDRYNGVIIPGTGWPDAAIGRVAIASDPSFNRLFTGGSKTFGQLQKKNFAPRIGLAYAFNNKNVLRAGIGTFYQRPGVADNVFLGGQAPFQPFVSVANGNVDNPGGTQGVGFPFYYMTQDPVYKIPRAHQWNVTFERELPFSMILTTGYIGRVGTHLERVRNLNQLQPGTIQANPGINVNALRPYKGFAQIDANENAARSEYNSFQLEANRRFSKGLLLGFAYTLSKSVDNGSQRRNILYNTYDDRNFWGPSEFDTRHIVMFNYVYELPIFNNAQGFKKTALGGWQVSGNTQWQTGTPFTVQTGDDFAGIGTGGQPWTLTGDIGYPKQFAAGGAADPARYFTATVSRPAAGTFANQTKNLFYSTSLQNWNVSAFKNFAFHDRHNLQFRAEFFNFPNHPNWNGPDSNPTSATFGKVTSKTSERNIQLVLRYSF
ncbi:MAG: carboxypeptidase regulatory-like domain-containing protein [Bryobacteraceae bacterium]